MAALDLPAARHAAKVVCTDLKTELDLFQYARLFEMRTRAGATIWEAHGCAFREVIE